MKEYKVLYQIKSLEKLVLRKIICEIDDKFPTPTQMQIIEYIVENKDDTYQKDLEKVLNLRRATVSGVLHTMEKNSLIKRVSDSKDARVKKIVLNEETNNLFLRNKLRMQELEKNIIKNIDKNDLDIFIKVIEKMKDNLGGKNDKIN